MAVMLAAALLGLSYAYVNKTPVTINYVTGPYTPPALAGEDLSSLYGRISPSVVSVVSTRWDDDQEIRREGTGFFVDREHVITNHHVVNQAESVEVELSSGDKLMAEFIGGDVYTDLAVLKTERKVNVTALTLANSSLVEPGTPVAAIGNPFGLHGSIASGIISAKGRTLKTVNDFLIVNLLQTDAPLNPGNSGGPLVTYDGLVVGVTVAKEGDNVGFAIPSNTVKKIVPVIVSGKPYRHPWFGVVAQPMTKTLATQLGLSKAKGIQVLQVNEGGPADQGGLRGSDKLKKTDKSQIMSGGDVVTKIDGVEINTVTDLMNYLEDETEVGENVTVAYVRDNREYNTTVTLGERK